MRVLYIASNPAGASPLSVEEEVNELQRRIDEVRPQKDVDLRVYSKLQIEDLPATISRVRPDVIHFSAHGEFDGIVLSHAEKNEVLVQGKDLVGIFTALGVRPKLVVFNACSSEILAKSVLSAADFTIGTTAPVSNTGAVAMAATLYQHLASSATIQSAFDAAKTMLDIVDGGKVTTILCASEGNSARATRLNETFRILAALPEIDKAITSGTAPPSFKKGAIGVEFGIADAPAGATQLVLFTDDRSITDAGYSGLEEARSWLQDADCLRGEQWLDPTYCYRGDISWFAVMVTSDRSIFTATATTCEALERYYLTEAWPGVLAPEIEASVRRAIRRLRANDGTRRAKFALGPKADQLVVTGQKH